MAAKGGRKRAGGSPLPPAFLRERARLARQRKAEKAVRSARSRRGAATLAQRRGAATTGRQVTKTGRPRNLSSKGKPQPYVPRTVTGELPERLERFDFRGLEPDQVAELRQKLYARIRELVREFPYVAMRMLVSYTPIAAAKRTVSPKAARSARFRAEDPLAQAAPITEWTPFEQVESAEEAYAQFLKIYTPEGREEIPDIEQGSLILAAELTWDKKHHYN